MARADERGMIRGGRACREGQQLLAAAELELLEAAQLTEPFGE